MEMADMAESNLKSVLARRGSKTRTSIYVHPAWLRLMRYCPELVG
jgi:hypothetical protein